ncbi:MAG: peptidase U32 family protein [Elusimicrobiota bacterium]
MNHNINKKRKKPELLAPAGNLRKLRTAFNYGADAVYVGGKKFGLRAAAQNFTGPEIKKGLEIARKNGKKIYVTLNIIPRDSDFKKIKEFIVFLDKIEVHGVIISDPGILETVRKFAPDLKLHLSTQANTTNSQSALFWAENGVKRIILARELNLEQITKIRKQLPGSVELETFVHGAMCMAYSGRCLLSSYLTGRQANRGECTQPCRWDYQLTERERPGEYFPVLEGENYTTILSSKDLCLAGHVPGLIEAGVNSFKIEGRMKSSYYVALVTSVYRKIIDGYFENPKDYEVQESLLQELDNVNHREYTENFVNNSPARKAQTYKDTAYIKKYEFMGQVKEYVKDRKLAEVETKNKLVKGDKVEFFQPGLRKFQQKVKTMFNEDMDPIDEAPHVKQRIFVKTERPVAKLDIMRKKIQSSG